MNLQETIRRILREEFLNESDPKTGTGKKPKGSDRRLYTDENPSDTVSVKFKTKEDIVDTLNKESFKSKPHKRQSQIINLIHQRVRAAYQNASDPETKKRLKRGLDYIEIQKEKSKQKTIELQKEENAETNEYARTLKNARKQGAGLRFSKSAIENNPQRFRHYTRQNTNEMENIIKNILRENLTNEEKSKNDSSKDKQKFAEINGKLVREYKFSSYKDTIDFVNKVSEIAEKQNHHPKMIVEYDTVKVIIFDHEEKKISDKCYKFVNAVEKIK